MAEDAHGNEWLELIRVDALETPLRNSLTAVADRCGARAGGVVGMTVRVRTVDAKEPSVSVGETGELLDRGW